MAYQNEAVVRRIMRDGGVSYEEAKNIFEDTKLFLVECGSSPGTQVPSERTDLGWHTFILFTRDYREFCEKYFDRFIDHAPRNDNTCSDIGGCKGVSN
jgi:hypothetical protein